MIEVKAKPENHLIAGIVDESKLETVKFSTNSRKTFLEILTTNSVMFDLIAKIIIFLGFIIYIFFQIHSVDKLMYFLTRDYQKGLTPSVIRCYIKYSLGFNSALILVLGYWFGSKGGFSKLIHRIVTSILERK